jgi:pimeloyl-ACP methyl ester carboxylesterase
MGRYGSINSRLSRISPSAAWPTFVHYGRMDALAHDVLAKAPPQFALVGLSFGRFVAMEIMRQSPERVLKLCLLDTSARPETDKEREYRQEQLSRARADNTGT